MAKRVERKGTKPKKGKKVKMKLDLDNDTLNYLEQVSDLANVSIDDTVSILLAAYITNLDDGK